MFKLSKYCFLAFLLYYVWITRLYGGSPVFNYIFLGGTLVCGYLGSAKIQEIGFIQFYPKSVMWIVYTAFALVTGLIVAKNNSLAIDQEIFMIELVLIMQYGYRVMKHDGNLNWFYNSFAVLSIVYSLSMLFNGMLNDRSMRLSLSETSNPNSDGIIMALGIYAILKLIKHEKKSYMIAAYAVVLLELYVIFQTGSRKALIIAAFFIAGYLFAIAANRQFSQNQKFIIIIIATATVAVAIWKLAPVYFQSTSYKRMQDAELGMNDRVKIAKDALGVFLKHPVCGVGLNNYKLYNAHGLYAHSTIPELLADTGIVGTLLYLIPFIWTVRDLKQCSADKWCLFIGLGLASFVVIIPFGLPMSLFSIILFIEADKTTGKI